MEYITPKYGEPLEVDVTEKSNKTCVIVCIIVTFILVGILVLAAIAVAVGVGLGVGLRHRGNDHAAAPTTTTTTIATTTVGRAPSSCPCGCSPVSIESLLSRVINGVPATANSWPWMVHVRMSGLGTCGGFLISSQHIITAAHCVSDIAPSRVKVYAGLQKVSQLSNADVRSVSAISSHPEYNPSTLENDIAVLKLSSSYTISAKIGACCLPVNGTSLPALDEKALVMGWGRTVDGLSSSDSDNLLQAIVQVQNSSATCTVSPTRLCAGLGTTDTCQGDSGGPLVTNVNNQWTCTGIVSGGINCGGFGSYTRVSAFRPFIDNALSTL